MEYLNDDEVLGVKIAVEVILQGSYTEEGVRLWWDRKRHDLGEKTPNEVVASDPVKVVRLALETLGMIAT